MFFLTGLWHGADYTFIAWGFYHGIFLMLERAGLQKYLQKSEFLSHLYLFLIVHFGWVIFKISSLKMGLLFMKRLLMPWKYTDFDLSFWKYGDNMTITVFICAILGMGILQKAVPEKIRQVWKNSVLEFVYCTVLLFSCIAALAGSSYNPFIYFQF